jgi:hypothetical protein
MKLPTCMDQQTAPNVPSTFAATGMSIFKNEYAIEMMEEPVNDDDQVDGEIESYGLHRGFPSYDQSQAKFKSMSIIRPNSTSRA